MILMSNGLIDETYKATTIRSKTNKFNDTWDNKQIYCARLNTAKCISCVLQLQWFDCDGKGLFDGKYNDMFMGIIISIKSILNK